MIKSTSRCFETIKAIDDQVEHLSYHQERFDKTRLELYGTHEKISLAEYIAPPLQGITRVRIEYDHEIRKIEYLPYSPRDFKTFLVVDTMMEYPYKYCNRDMFNAYDPLGNDEIIFTCNNEIKDTRIANIALWIDGEWKTPRFPFLKGTTRARLLANGVLKEEVLFVESLQKAKKFAIMNALIGFKIINEVCIKE